MAQLEIDDLPYAPPALPLMLREFKPGRDWAEIRKHIRGSLRDLKDQSVAFDLQNAGRSEKPNARRFEIHAHGALDLLSGHGCMDLKCRISAAEKLARSLGLIADRVWLTDHLSTEVLTLGRATNDKLDRLMQHAVVLGRLLPLIKAGIVRFRSPWIATCGACAAEFDRQVESATEAVIRSFRRQVHVVRKRSGGFFIDTGNIFEPSMYLHSVGRPLSEAQYAEQIIRREVRQILWIAREATFTRGAVFSSSRAALAGMLQCEGRLPGSRESLRLFENSRSFDVPWVSSLDPAQVIQLREEASSAIPAFREMLAQAIAAKKMPRSAESNVEFVSALRSQAAEVRAELLTKQSKSARYWKVAYGVLGFGLSAYGVATDQVLPGIGGILPILQLLIAHKTGHEVDVAKIKSRPGYVLVKAQDILAHAA